MSQAEADPVEQPRTRIGCLLLIIPALITVGVLLGYIVMWTVGLRGREVDGLTYDMIFQSCPEALPLVQARVARMGLGNPQYNENPEGFVITARLPSEPDVAKTIPKTLARTGALEIRAVGAAADAPPIVPAEQVDDTSVHLGMSGIATLVRLDAEGSETLRKHMIANPDGRIQYLLDGEEVANRSNLPAEPRGNLELTPPLSDEVTQLRVAAEWDVIIAEGPLPCPIVLLSATPVQDKP